MYDENVKKQSHFSRSMANDMKLGAYYTDQEHCQWIGKYLNFPEGEVCCLEPSIGDGTAIRAVLESSKAPHAQIYAVELNKETYNAMKEENFCRILLGEDFLTGIKISANAFSFCFANPPYGENVLKKERLELSFLKRISGTMKPNGVLVYIIPEYVFRDTKFLKEWYQRYTTAGIYRFHEKEYQKFKQVCIFGIKKKRHSFFKQEVEELYQQIENIEEISSNYCGEKINVPVSYGTDISYFTTMQEDPEKNILALQNSPVFNALNLEQKKYTNTQLNAPVVELKKDLKYLLAVSGGGQGLAGSEENGDLHLQRGTVKRVQHSQFVPVAEGSDTLKEIVTETSSVVMTIIENDGTITRFEN